MKVCFLIADMSARGGTERVTSMIANGLVERSFEVEIISCRNEAQSFFILNKKIRIHALRAECVKNSVLRKFMNFRKIWKLVNHEAYDVIIAVDVYIYLYLLPLQIMRKCKCIAWEHFNCHVSNMKLSHLARIIAVRFADQVVVLGKKDLKNYQDHFKGAKNVTYIYNPVAFEKTINKNIDQHRIIAAGRLTEQKGFDLLIDTWNMIEEKAKDSDWVLNIYGEGELKKQLENQIIAYGLKRVYLKGYAENIHTEYLNSSIFVLSSRYEGFGLVLIEALACGLPCISFDCKEGPCEIIADGINGYLVENGNTSQLADRLMDLMRNDQLRKQFSANTYQDLHRFELQKVLDRWEALLNRKISE